MWDTPLISDLNYCFYFLDSWESKDVRKMKRFRHGHSFTKYWQEMVMNMAEVITSAAFRVISFLLICFPCILGRLSPLQVTSRMRD